MTASADSDDEPSPAEDAIPYGAITLVEALSLVHSILLMHPEKTEAITAPWFEVLRKSRDKDRSKFNAEYEEIWHLKKAANLILRRALENDELSACIRDPRNAETLRLSAEGWLPLAWIDRSYVSPRWLNHASPGHIDNPGPKGSVQDGEPRLIFFLPSAFDEWLESFCPDVQRSGLDLYGKETDLPAADTGWRSIDAVKEAFQAIWGEVPAGLPAAKQDEIINAWLKDNGRIAVSSKTIFRARTRLRQDPDTV
jgi:hypothetical protein